MIWKPVAFIISIHPYVQDRTRHSPINISHDGEQSSRLNDWLEFSMTLSLYYIIDAKHKSNNNNCTERKREPLSLSLVAGLNLCMRVCVCVCGVTLLFKKSSSSLSLLFGPRLKWNIVPSTVEESTTSRNVFIFYFGCFCLLFFF